MPPRNYRASPRRPANYSILFGSFVLFALFAAGVVGTLWLAGVPLNPFARAEPKDDPYMVRIPINAQPIPAYSRVDRNHLLHPTSGVLMFQRVPPAATVGLSIVGIARDGSHIEDNVQAVKNVSDEVVFVTSKGEEIPQSRTMELGGALLNVNAIIGRVVKADKRAGLGFQESTFFPLGTPEGLAGATPQGMRAITLDATKLTGVHALNAGDEIDLLATVAIDGQDPVDSSAIKEVKLLAQNAKVLRPVYTRNEVSASSSLTQGKKLQNVPKYEVAIAVSTDDVIPLQNALHQELAITCIAHSMKPKDPGANSTVVQASEDVRVPVTVRPILAYDVVTRDAFVSPATRTIKTEVITRSEAERIGAIVALEEAIGSIVRQDIPSGRYLRHSDLLNGPPSLPAIDGSDNRVSLQNSTIDPSNRLVTTQSSRAPENAAPTASSVGDRPALSKFIPPGCTAFAIPLNRLFGAEHLQIGDTIDLLASYSLERTRDEEETETRPDGTTIVRRSESVTPRKTQRTWEESFGNRAEPWFVASNAIVVAPVGFPAPAAAQRAIYGSNGNANENTKPAQGASASMDGPPVIIAVENRDIESIATALATRDALFTVAIHSAEPISHQGQRKVIAVAPEAIEAYSKLDETLWQANRRTVMTRLVSLNDPRFEKALTPGQLSDYFGCVLKVAKSRGACFQADDFLVDTEPGMTNAISDGHTLVPISDREIEGLDSFLTNDRVTIILRGVFKSKLTRELDIVEGVASSSVIAKSVRIVRSSQGGQSVLEVNNSDLTRLQAAVARSLTDREDMNDRSHLIAVGLSRMSNPSEGLTSSDIQDFDPFSGVRTTDLIIGGNRRTAIFHEAKK